MTAEKRYELIVGMLRMHEVKDGPTEGITNEIIKNPSAWVNSDYFPFYANGAQLILECREEMDKQNGVVSSSLAAVKRIYKSACSSVRQELHGAFRSGDKWTICDNYRFIRLNSKPESIPEAKSDLDIERVIGDARDGEIVALPSVSEVKAKIAELKGMYGKGWKAMPIEPLPGWYCNPQYLLDMLQALPNGRAHLPKNSISPLYYESDDGDALVLAVRHKTN